VNRVWDFVSKTGIPGFEQSPKAAALFFLYALWFGAGEIWEYEQENGGKLMNKLLYSVLLYFTS
jgi:hypothetical protein